MLGLSCATGAGVAEPARRARARARRRPRAPSRAGAGEDELADYLLYRPRARQRIFRLVRDDGIVRIAGRDVVSLVDQLDLATPEGVRELSLELGRLGVIDALRHAGVKPGHEVAIGDERFEFSLPPEEAGRHDDGGDDDGRSRMVSTDTPRVGVLGSLCNPVHLGHLLLCQEATWQLGLSRVVLVPTGMPPHRPAPPESAAMRLRLAQAAAIGNPALTVSRVEIERPGPSYMVDTLRELAQRYPGQRPRAAARLRPVRGALDLARARAGAAARPIAVARRPGVSPDVLADADIERIEMPQVDISSSMIRERVAAGRPIRHLVPDPVRELIEAEGLYR